MLILKRTALVAAAAIPLFILPGCFPTQPDDGNDNPTDDPITITENDNPEDLPTDIDPTANTSDDGIDSMFNLLITRVREFENVEAPSDFYTLDFTSLKQGFGAAVKNSPNHVKANVGFIVASVLSVNGNKDLQKMIDSIEAYINDMDAYYENETFSSPAVAKKKAAKKTIAVNPGLLSKTFAGHGLLSAGQMLFAETPKVLMAQTSRPSFPRFLTMSYIQNMVETGVIPLLNEVIAATQRLRALDAMSLAVTIDDETAEIDAGDIMIFEAIIRSARAGFTMMCIYDYDLYSPDGSNDMRWIDDYIEDIDNMEYSSQITYSLNNDTLYETYYTDMTEATSKIMETYRYNISRSKFLSIRRNFHTAAYNDLKEIPVLIKSGLTSIKNEKDPQDDDLIPSADIFDLSSDMGDLTQEMLEAGFSSEFAGKFQSPEALMDFISLMLTQPYTFDETIDGIHLELTVDISKFFTNPATSLKEYWPKYKVLTGNDQYVTYEGYNYVDEWPSSQFYVHEDDYDVVTVTIPESLIDSIAAPSYTGGPKMYILKDEYSCTKTVDSIRMAVPYQMVDDDGNPINIYELMSNEFTTQTLSEIFPYFNDYTFKGIFPEMKTRQTWIDFFSVFIE